MTMYAESLPATTQSPIHPIPPRVNLWVKIYAFGSCAATVLFCVWSLYKIYYVQGNPRRRQMQKDATEDVETTQRDRSSSVASDMTLTEANTIANAQIGKAGERSPLQVDSPISPPRVKTYAKGGGHRAEPRGRYDHVQDRVKRSARSSCE